MTLRTFLDDPARPAGTLRYHELEGFLFTLAAAPELIRPSEWMPMVFGDQEPEYRSLDEAKAMLGELMAAYNAVNAAAAESPATLPADCAFRPDPMANLDEEAPIAQWSRGFVVGHQWLEELWDSCVPEDLDDEFGAMLMTLSFFSSRKLADAFLAETHGADLPAMARTMCEVFPDALAEYARLGRSIQTVLATTARTEKVGRNDPCPCGSGRKFKKCCGAPAR